MPSRLAFGRRTNASARLLALFCVMERLSCISTSAIRLRVLVAAVRRFAARMDYAAGGRGAAGVSGPAGALRVLSQSKTRLWRNWVLWFRDRGGAGLLLHVSYENADTPT